MEEERKNPSDILVRMTRTSHFTQSLGNLQHVPGVSND